jgi:predicted DNA-binding protein with PD1-like motif
MTMSSAVGGAGTRLHCVRLSPGDDVLRSLLDFVTVRGIQAAAVVSCVGSTGRTVLRPAGGERPRTFEGKFEVVSLSGTIAPGGAVDGDVRGGPHGEKHHLHLSVSGRDCRTVGGHLLAGTTVRTTLEIVVAELVGIAFDRPLDPRTGYAELSIRSLGPGRRDVVVEHSDSLPGAPTTPDASSNPASTASLQFNNEPLDSFTISRLRRQLRLDGYCILPDVFERDSMLAFNATVRGKLERGRRFDVFGNPTDFEKQPHYRDQLWLPNDLPEVVEPIRAPRIKQFIPSTLTPTDRPAKVQVFECAWLVDEQTEPGQWHKDYPHYEEMDLESYQCPEAIYLAVYLRDMTEEAGPTQLVRASYD